MSNAKRGTGGAKRASAPEGTNAVVFFGKVVIFLATFGFVFPTILGD